MGKVFQGTIGDNLPGSEETFLHMVLEGNNIVTIVRVGFGARGMSYTHWHSYWWLDTRIDGHGQ